MQSHLATNVAKQLTLEKRLCSCAMPSKRTGNETSPVPTRFCTQKLEKATLKPNLCRFQHISWPRLETLRSITHKTNEPNSLTDLAKRISSSRVSASIRAHTAARTETHLNDARHLAGRKLRVVLILSTSHDHLHA